MAYTVFTEKDLAETDLHYLLSTHQTHRFSAKLNKQIVIEHQECLAHVCSSEILDKRLETSWTDLTQTMLRIVEVDTGEGITYML